MMPDIAVSLRERLRLNGMRSRDWVYQQKMQAISFEPWTEGLWEPVEDDDERVTPGCRL